MSDRNGPNLNDVLRTLSALSSNQPRGSQDPTSIPSHPVEGDDDSYEPSEALPSLSTIPETTPNSHVKSFSSTDHARDSNRETYPRNSPQLIDTSTVTTWPAALQHLMRAMSQNDDLQRRVRRLIQRQHDHERQWWRGHKALQEKQNARAEKKKELDAVLRSVGAPVDSKQISTADEDRMELQNYDGKVYMASKQMAKAMMSELQALQIPFFSIKPQLISDTTFTSPNPTGRASSSVKDDLDGKELLSKEELFVLRRRMLELLQDLCRE